MVQPAAKKRGADPYVPVKSKPNLADTKNPAP